VKKKKRKQPARPPSSAAQGTQDTGLKHYWLPVLLFLALCVCYANSFESPFFFDSQSHIVENPHIAKPIAFVPEVAKTRLFAHLTFSLNYHLSKFDVGSYHAVNLLIHALAALFLFGLVRRSLLTGPLRERFAKRAEPLAFASALLWALHPIQTQSVTYLIQRSESMMGMFYIGVLYAFIRGDQEGGAQKRWAVLAILFGVLGMLTKEVMVTIPIMALLFDRVLLSDSWKACWQKHKVSYRGLFAGWILLGTLLSLAEKKVALSAGFGYAAVSPIQYLMTQAEVLPHYLKIMILPLGLCFDYAWTAVSGIQDVLIPGSVMTILLLVSIYLLLKRRLVGLLIFAFFLILAPTSSILPIQDIAVEHRLYLPLIPICIGIIFIIEGLLARFSFRSFGFNVIVVLLAGFLGQATIQRNAVYANEVRLWTDTVMKSPHNARAIIQLANALLFEGREDEAVREYERVLASDTKDPQALSQANIGIGYLLTENNKKLEAFEYFKRATELNPYSAEAHYNLGIAYVARKELDLAEEHYRRALRLRPHYPESHHNIGVVYAMRGQHHLALESYEKAIALKIDYAQAYYSLAGSLVALRRLDEAITFYEQAIYYAPRFADAHNNLAATYLTLEKYELAVKHGRAAIKHNPNLATAYDNLGTALAMMGDMVGSVEQHRKALKFFKGSAKLNTNLANALISLGEYDEAVMHYRRALATNPRYQKAHNNLGATYARLKLFRKAIMHAKVALHLNPNDDRARQNLKLTRQYRKQERLKAARAKR